MLDLPGSSLFVLLSGAGLVAGIVRGLAGFGGPLLLIPVLNLVYAPAITIPAVLLADTLASVQLLPEALRQSDRRVVVRLLIGTAAALPAGAAVLLLVEPEILKRMISGFILALAFVVLSGWRYPRPLTGAGYISVGALGGAVMSATGIAAAVPLFLNAGHDSAAQNRFHFIVWVFGASALILVALGAAGRITGDLAVPVLALLPTYALGVHLGRKLLPHVPDVNLRRLVLGLVVVVALVGLVA